MARSKRAVNAVKKRRKVLKLAKGYFGAKSKQYRSASQQVMKSLSYAYRAQDQKARITASCGSPVSTPGARMNGTTYSRMMNGPQAAGVEVNARCFADLAVTDMPAFKELVDVAMAARA
jgi:large subunit ribosomal protein L20